jgi:hypothetical protein
MHSWIFYITDGLSTMTAVVGAGESRSDAEADALAKLDTSISNRDDYAARAVIQEVVYSTIGTEMDGDMPGLIL